MKQPHPFTTRLAADVAFSRTPDGRLGLRHRGQLLELNERDVADGPRRAGAAANRLPPPLEYAVSLGGEVAMTLRPMAPTFCLDYRPLAANEVVRSSRFAILYRDAATPTLESPWSGARVRLLTPTAVVLWAELANVRGAEALAASHGLAVDEVTHCLELLLCAGMVAIADEEGLLPEDREQSGLLWSLPEALFHNRSRWGQHDWPLGATFPFARRWPAPPAAPPAFPGAKIPLSRPPRLDDGPTATAVLAARRSARDVEARCSPSLEQVGHLLYHAARASGGQTADPATPRSYDTVLRPYPTGGAMGDLEIYLIAGHCTGLPKGGYHYDSHAHQLVALDVPSDEIDSLLSAAQHSAQMSNVPHLLLSIAWRYERTLWKYQGMGYAKTLKDVGALMQTLYLVGTVLGIGVCALGAGRTESIGRLAGGAGRNEVAVGEVAVLGR